MARTRLLKPGFFKNPVLARLSERHRLLFAGLWLIADRDGRLKDDPVWIRGELFPYEPDINIDALLTDLHRSGFIQRYKVRSVPKISTGGESSFPQGESAKSRGESRKSPIRAIAIPKFATHQHPHIREQNGQLPPPPAPTKVGARHLPRLPVSNTVPVPKDQSSAGQSSAATAAPPASNPGTKSEAQQNVGVITKIAHDMIDLLGAESSDLVETVKGMCAHHHIAYDSAAVRKAIDSARVQRQKALGTP